MLKSQLLRETVDETAGELLEALRVGEGNQQPSSPIIIGVKVQRLCTCCRSVKSPAKI